MRAICEHCGYDLLGVAPDGRQAPCPECGSIFTAQRPFVPRPIFPGILAFAAVACLPNTLLVAMASAWQPRPSLEWLAMLALVLAWPVTAIVIPSWAAGIFVRRRSLLRRRTRVGVAIACAAIALNIAATFDLPRWF